MGQIDNQVTRFRRSLWQLLWMRWTIRAMVGGLWIAGFLIVAARLLWQMPIVHAFWGLIPLFAMTLFGAWLTRRHLPPSSVIRAEIDRCSRAEGLVMAEAEISLGNWRSQINPESLRRPKIGWSLRRPMSGLCTACVFVAATLLLPDAWLARGDGDEPQLDIAADVARLEKKLEVLEELSVMPPEDTETLRADLKQVESHASGDDPAKTLEALEHVENRLAQVAEEEAAEASETARKGAELAAAAQALNRAASQMSRETLESMMDELSEMTKKAQKESEVANKENLDAAGGMCEDGLSVGELGALGNCLGNCPAAMQQLLGKLADAGLIDPNQLGEGCPALSPEELEALALALSECEPGDADLEELLEACRLCLGNCPGEGNCPLGCRPGRGGISRGPGHAKLNFDGETESHSGKFAENKILAPGGIKKDGRSVLRNVGRGKPGQKEERATSDGSGLAASGGAGGAHTRVVLPSHRRVVREYFDRTSR